MRNLKREIKNLVGERVSFKRIIGNSIILYFHGNPGDMNVESIWIEPIWRYEKNKKYVVSSSEFPWKKKRNQSEKEFNKEFDSLCDKTNSLVRSKVQQIIFNESTNDIYINLERNQVLRSFAAFSDGEIWVYRNVQKKYSLWGYHHTIEKIPAS
jgi:hypothetical protein